MRSGTARAGSGFQLGRSKPAWLPGDRKTPNPDGSREDRSPLLVATMQKRVDMPESGESWASQTLRRPRSGRLLSSGSDRAPRVDRRDRLVSDAIATDRPAGPLSDRADRVTGRSRLSSWRRRSPRGPGPVAQLRLRSPSLAHGHSTGDLIPEPKRPVQSARSARRGRRRLPRPPPGLSPRRARHRR